MPTYISILRGINVSGHKKISMKDLKALYETLGCKEVRTYIQSGNVVFEHSRQAEATLEKKIEEQIAAHYGFEVPVLVRTVQEWEQALEDNPFLKEKEIETDKLHLTFLEREPAAAQAARLAEVHYEPDRFVLSGRTVYVYCPGGYGNTKLSNTFFENKLKVKATTRNLKTAQTLLQLGKGE